MLKSSAENPRAEEMHTKGISKLQPDESLTTHRFQFTPVIQDTDFSISKDAT